MLPASCVNTVCIVRTSPFSGSFDVSNSGDKECEPYSVFRKVVIAAVGMVPYHVVATVVAVVVVVFVQ